MWAMLSGHGVYANLGSEGEAMRVLKEGKRGRVSFASRNGGRGRPWPTSKLLRS